MASRRSQIALRMRSSELLGTPYRFSKSQRLRTALPPSHRLPLAGPILAKFCEALRFDRFEFASEHGFRVQHVCQKTCRNFMNL